MVALGLAIVVVGIIDLFEVQHVFSLILSVVLGGIFGELLHMFNSKGKKVETIKTCYK